jgi:pantoate--beta-alanine ligase
VAKEIREGIIKTPDAAIASLTEEIGDTPLARIDYLEIVDSRSLEAITSLENANPRLLAAVFFGKTRLIDNVGLPALID